MVIEMARKLIQGVGINDADYAVNPYVKGKRIICRFYKVWSSMLERCYSESLHKRRPTYIGCSVCPEWHLFSNFKSWMEEQDWQGKELDKDILVAGNKVYSPDSCKFVDQILNTFIEDRAASRGNFMIGVSFNKSHGKFAAQCRNPFSKKGESIGYFDDELSAHKAWKARKHEHAVKLASMQKDSDIAYALHNRYK